MSQTQHLQEHLQQPPFVDMAVTDGWPVLARVVIVTRHKHLLNATESQKAVAQVVDFYPKAKPCGTR